DDAASALAQKYRPVIGIQTQSTPCGPGEPYLPTDALATSERPDVVLRDPSGRVLLTAPTAADLAAAAGNTNIDYPGNALAPGCDFERWFRAAGPPPTAVYGRVLVDAQHPEFTVLQYWMYWIYNDWNNRHEGDWEMMQIVFNAPSAEEALTTTPSDVVLSQHEGAERAPWADVQQRDGRPVVYPAGGSHATFFEQDRFLGKSAEAGFGCDDTRPPSTMLDPEVIMLPAVVDPNGPDAWLLWQGRWGERRPSFNNGPQGPLSKRQWDEPIGWMNDTGRTHSLRAPAFGNDVTDFFCSATERVSMVLLRGFDDPWLIGGLFVAAVVALVLIGRRTRWSPVIRTPIAARRRSGQILRSAAHVLISERKRFAPIALLVLAGGLLATAVRQVLLSIPAISDTDLLFAGDRLGRALFALVSGAIITIPIGIVAVSIGVATASDLDTGDQPVGLATMIRHRGLGATVAIVALAFVLLGPITFVLGAFLTARWAVAPAIAVNDSGFRPSLREASMLTKGNRWRVGTVVVVAATVATLLGPFVGALVLIATGTSFGFVNVLAAFVTALLLPWLAIVIVMVHGDLLARRTPSPDTLTAVL
ncbi:MAG: hypothetical protein RJA49_155, partial [Actinomycetota bacterium]